MQEAYAAPLLRATLTTGGRGGSLTSFLFRDLVEPRVHVSHQPRKQTVLVVHAASLREISRLIPVIRDYEGVPPMRLFEDRPPRAPPLFLPVEVRPVRERSLVPASPLCLLPLFDAIAALEVGIKLRCYDCIFKFFRSSLVMLLRSMISAAMSPMYAPI
jgi:hypothetical protein